MMDALVAIFLLAAAAPADAPPTEGAESAQEEKICKRQTRTATRLPAERICRTWAEWQKEDRAKGQQTGGLDMFSTRNGTGDIGGMQSGDSPN